MKKGPIVVAGVAIIALLVGLAVGSFLLPTAKPTPTMTLNSNTVARGGLINATLTGFPANIDIYGWTVNQSPPTSWKVGTTNANGQLSTWGYAPNATGLWPLVACDENHQYLAVAMLNVTQ